LKFSTVIVNYDSWPHTLRCVEALLETGRRDLEILVVDNEGGPAPELPEDVTLVRSL
jgi:GT2 family glycosyltransferase